MNDNNKQFEQFKKYINFFDHIIKSKQKSRLKEFLKLIKDSESIFLESYNKRKKEGVYYTDEEVSRFIIKKAIIELINKKLNKTKNHEILINSFNDIFKLDQNLKNKIIKLLLNLSICDPTCGSGVFLTCATDILFELIQSLSISKDPIEIKTQILRNIYGLDINPYAIKLCSIKLLTWLYKDAIFNNLELSNSIFSNLKVKNTLFSNDWPRNLFYKKNFDIIVGNPPYGNILNKEEKDILKNQNLFYNDIYCAFLIRALDWIDGGIVGFLIPKSFLLRQSYLTFRKEFLANTSLLNIYDIGANLFKNATNEVQILIYQKNKNNDIHLNVYNYPEKKICTYKNQKFDDLRICINLECPLCVNSKKFYVYTFNKNCSFCKSKTRKLNRIRIKLSPEIHTIINKLEKEGDLNYLNISDFPKMIRGEEDKGLQLVKKNLLNSSHENCFYINAKDDFKYYYLNMCRSFNIKNIDGKLLKGDNYEYYLNPKLLIKHNNIIPEAVYTEDKVCFSSSIYSLLFDDIDELKYLCAILNSALMHFYCIYGINNQKDTTINLNQYMIRHLPIIKPKSKIKTQIANYVDEIEVDLKLHNGNYNNQINNLLKNIDDILFDLYSISKEEKELIISTITNQIKHFKSIYG
ncbi:MAG: Eco57I restriction-modification methylase domain-containing protein [Promethearchaeota archaeon]